MGRCCASRSGAWVPALSCMTAGAPEPILSPSKACPEPAEGDLAFETWEAGLSEILPLAGPAGRAPGTMACGKTRQGIPTASSPRKVVARRTENMAVSIRVEVPDGLNPGVDWPPTIELGQAVGNQSICCRPIPKWNPFRNSGGGSKNLRLGDMNHKPLSPTMATLYPIPKGARDSHAIISRCRSNSTAGSDMASEAAPYRYAVPALCRRGNAAGRTAAGCPAQSFPQLAAIAGHRASIGAPAHGGDDVRDQPRCPSAAVRPAAC